MNVWEQAGTLLDGLPGGDGLNIAYEAVDRHVLHGRGDHFAFRFVGSDLQTRDMTFAQLSQASNRFANVLRSLRIEPGDSVFSLTRSIPQLYVAALGALKARAVFSALYTSLGAEPLRTRLAKGDAKLVLTTSALYRRRVADIRATLPSLRHVVLADAEAHGDGVLSYDALMAEASESYGIEPTSPEDPAFIHFTSGTSTEPKGAVCVHAAAIAHAATARSILQLGSEDVFWCTADPGWVMGISYGLAAPLLLGITTLVDEGEFDPARCYRIIQDHRVSVLYTAPTPIRLLMKAGARLARSYDLSSLRLIACAGEALNPALIRWGRQALGLDIHDTWWQTETGAIMIGTAADHPVALGVMGPPADGITAAIASRLPGGRLEFIDQPNRVGELVLKSGWPSMFRTYVGEPELYEERFSNGWYLTGDLVCRDAEGRFSFVSRNDELIKSAGHLIGPSEVESSLLEHPAVAEAGAVGKPDPLTGESVKAFVALRDGHVPDETLRLELVEFARSRLGSALAPREITFCRSLPKTRSGKILRRLLRARELGMSDDSAAEVDPNE